jgi:hypothetical protein
LFDVSDANLWYYVIRGFETSLLPFSSSASSFGSFFYSLIEVNPYVIVPIIRAILAVIRVEEAEI